MISNISEIKLGHSNEGLDLINKCDNEAYTPESFRNFVRNSYAVYEDSPVTIIKVRNYEDPYHTQLYVRSSTEDEMSKQYELIDYNTGRLFRCTILEFMNEYTNHMTHIYYNCGNGEYFIDRCGSSYCGGIKTKEDAVWLEKLNA